MAETDFTPIENLLAVDSNMALYQTDRMRLYRLKHSMNLPSVRFYKALFGRQTRCMQGKYRYWVWEHISDEWRIFVSNTRGMGFEVKKGLSAVKALIVWKSFYKEVLKRNEENK